MDQSKAGASRRRRGAWAAGLESLEGRRLMSTTTSQVEFMEGTTNGTPVLVITGTNKSDMIDISDNGTNAPGNITVTLGNGAIYTSQSAISLVEVDTKGGNDQVTYNLTSALLAPRTVMVRLGNGTDQFTGNIDAAIDNSYGLDLEGYAGSGRDTLTIKQPGAVLEGTFSPYLQGGKGIDTLTYAGTGQINAGASITPGLIGGSGSNTISSLYAGQINGTYIDNLTVTGGPKTNKITDVIGVAAGSTGTVGASPSSPAVVEGGKGRNTIQFAVAVDPSATAQVYAAVMGPRGTKDVVQHTSNVPDEIPGAQDSVIS